MHAVLPGPVSQSVSSPIADPGVEISIPAQSHTLVEAAHEIFAKVFLLPLTQDGLLSVTSESACKKYWLTA